MASYVLPASRAGIASIVTTPTTMNTFAVPLNVIVTEAGSGGGGTGGGATSVRVVVLA